MTFLFKNVGAWRAAVRRVGGFAAHAVIVIGFAFAHGPENVV
jgi:hypothetical protein